MSIVFIGQIFMFHGDNWILVSFFFFFNFKQQYCSNNNKNKTIIETLNSNSYVIESTTPTLSVCAWICFFYQTEHNTTGQTGPKQIIQKEMELPARLLLISEAGKYPFFAMQSCTVLHCTVL